MSVRAALAVVIVAAGLPANLASRAAVAAVPEPPRQLRTVAGSDGAGTATALAQQPQHLAYRAGVLYSVDGGGGYDDAHWVVRALDLSSGEQRLIAGTARPRRVVEEGPAANLLIRFPTGLTVDPAGRVYVSDDDVNTHELFRVDPDGTAVVPLYFEDSVGGWLHPSTYPGVSAAAADGTVYVVDDEYALNASRVYALTPDGHRRLVAGTGASSYSCSTGPATSVAIGQVYGLALDANGRLLISAGGCVVRLDASGNLVRVAGGDPNATGGDGGPALTARLDARAIAVDGANLYVVDYPTIRKVAADGTISTVAGNGSQRFPRGDIVAPLTPAQAGDGAPATSVPLTPGAVAAAGGTLWFTDYETHRIRVVSNGVLGTVAGNGDPVAGGDGQPALGAQLSQPTDVAVLPGGGYVVATPYSARVRKVSAAGVVSTLAGTGEWNDTGDGGPATAAALREPRTVAAGPDGSVYVANWNTIRRIAPNGTITRFAGNGTSDPPVDGVQATQSSVSGGGFDVGPDGSVYLGSADGVRRIRPDGVIETVAGGNGRGYAGDGGPARLAKFDSVNDVDVQADGGYYVADWNNGRVRYVSPAGLVTTVAGGGADNPPGPYDGDGDGGPATAAYLGYPNGVAADADGTVYIQVGRKVRAVTNGIITTVAGRDDTSYPREAGPDVVAATRAPLLTTTASGIDVSADGLLLAEYGANRLRLLLPDIVPVAPAPVTATAGSRRATVHWAEPAAYAGSPVDAYAVSLTPADNGPAVSRTVPATERQATLIGLRNGVDYTVAVRAVNAAGPGTAATTTVRPRPGLPGPPRYVAARAGSGSARVDWTRPEDGGGTLDAYRVTAQPGGTTVEVAGDATSAEVGGLANGTPYRFTVAAHNQAGWGPASPPTDPVIPDGPATASFTVRAALLGPETVTFPEPVRDVDTGNVVLRDRATGGAVAVALACRTDSGAAVVCGEDALSSVTVTPRSALTPGAVYDLTVNPPNARPVVDLDGVAVATVTAGLRASTVEEENTAGGKRLWRRVSDSHAEGGEYAVEHLTGARASASVGGTKVTWLTALGPEMGRAELWVDGVRRATYDNYAPARVWQVPRTVAGLANTTHTVDVRTLGRGDVVVDALGGTVRYEWARVPSTHASGGAYGVADRSGAQTSFTFRGTALAWYAVRGPGYGLVNVYVDGHRLTTVDYYAATTTYGYRRGVSGLAAGLHTVQLVVLGTKSPAATGTRFALDRWQVTA